MRKLFYILPVLHALAFVVLFVLCASVLRSEIVDVLIVMVNSLIPAMVLEPVLLALFSFVYSYIRKESVKPFLLRGAISIAAVGIVRIIFYNLVYPSGMLAAICALPLSLILFLLLWAVAYFMLGNH